MLGYKLAHAEVIKFAMDENERLKQERAELLGELEASLSPEMAQHVEKIIDRRGSFIPDDVLAPRPKPVHMDGADMDEPMGLALEVRTHYGPTLARASLQFASSMARRVGAHADADGRGSTGECFGRASWSSSAGSSPRCTLLATCPLSHPPFARAGTCRHR